LSLELEPQRQTLDLAVSLFLAMSYCMLELSTSISSRSTSTFAAWPLQPSTKDVSVPSVL